MKRCTCPDLRRVNPGYFRPKVALESKDKQRSLVEVGTGRLLFVNI